MGRLAHYSDQGYEGCDPAILIDERGIREPGLGSPQRYLDLDWSVTLDVGDRIEVFAEDGALIFKGEMQARSHRIAHDRWYCTVYPAGVAPDVWEQWLENRVKACLTFVFRPYGLGRRIVGDKLDAVLRRSRGR